MPIASVAKSGRPILIDHIGDLGEGAEPLLDALADREPNRSARCRAACGSRSRIDPSSSRGMNSVPMKNSEPIATPSTTAAAPTVSRAMRRSPGRARAGSAALTAAIHRLCRSATRAGMPRRNTNDASVGTIVRASSSDPKSAEQTVIAIGRNMRPSRPCEEEDRDVDGDDDGDGEHHRPGDFVRRAPDRFDAAARTRHAPRADGRSFPSSRPRRRRSCRSRSRRGSSDSR